jgi:hypothetical protein
MRYCQLFVFLFLISCGPGSPENVQRVLASSNRNAAELQKVIEHYEKLGDEEKLRASYFLIGNMIDKFGYDGDAVHSFDPIFSVLDSLHRNKIPVTVNSPVIKRSWDSLVGLYGTPQTENAEVVTDYENVKAKDLIEYIEWSFRVKKEFPWIKHLSFEQFCELILPHRVGNEMLEPWREHLYEEFKNFRDTVKAKNVFAFASALNAKIKSFISTNRTLWQYPFDMKVSTMEKGRRGACRHLVNYEAMVMRANGVPVGIDYLPLWGTVDKGHEWNTVLLEDGKYYPFDAAQTPFGGLSGYPYRFAKVYRKTFAPQDVKLPPKQEAPYSLLDRYRLDVTQEYTKTFDISVPIENIYTDQQTALLCTYRTSDWGVQDWGFIKGKTVQFKNIGANIVYIVRFSKNNRYQYGSNPFILDGKGRMHFIRASAQKKQSMELLRKYPSFPSNDSNMLSMRGGRFQVANKADFSDSITVAVVAQAPTKIELINLSVKKQYRYFRYATPVGQKANVAELEVYGRTGNAQQVKQLTGEAIGYPKLAKETGFGFDRVFDQDLETFFTTEKKDTSWVGLDFKKPVLLDKLRYCPRSDTDFILEGNTYELCYWELGKWISMGKKVAIGQSIVYTGVPSNALYILHNVSKGNEERIFTFENGKQVWW